MIFVNRNTIPIPDVFYSKEIEIAKRRLAEFYDRPKESRSQEKYTRPFEPELRDRFLSALREVFNGKCAYCESEVSLAVAKSIYDHFRPKNGARGFEKEFSTDHYWWLTYEWNNLYYSCPNCNQYKSTWFPTEGPRAPLNSPYEEIISIENSLLIDPCIDKPEEHFTYNEQGEVDFITAKGKTTIEIIKLNRKDLIELRRKAIEILYGEWELILNLYKKKDSNKKQIKKIHLSWESLFNEPSPQPYIGIRRFMLAKWLSNYPDLQRYLADRTYEKIGINKTIKGIENTEYFHQKNIKEGDKKSIDEKIKIELIRHIYVEKILIENFKCFSFLELDFSNKIKTPKGEDPQVGSEPWLLFLGENGVGKSSILKALVIGLTGNEYIQELGISSKDILKHGADSGYIEIHLVGSANPIKVTFNKNGISTTLSQPIVNIVAYNSIRLKPQTGKIDAERAIFYGAKAKNLFDYTFSLVDADNWLATLPKEIFDRACLALKDLMLLDFGDGIEIENHKAIVRRGNERFLIEELSDGYKSVFYLAVDIMATLAGENVTFDLAEGMVLIDEIGTHLHPRWRMEVVGRLRKTFPKIRFVVTTHEPLCLRGLYAGEIVVLTKDENKEVIALTELPDPSELRIDQILTSELFGLKSTIDPETEKLFNEYYEILALDDKDRSEDQKNRLLELSQLVPKIKHLGDTEREEITYYVIDELLARKTRDEGLKIKQVLKAEAVKRVKSIWNTLDNKNKYFDKG